MAAPLTTRTDCGDDELTKGWRAPRCVYDSWVAQDHSKCLFPLETPTVWRCLHLFNRQQWSQNAWHLFNGKTSHFQAFVHMAQTILVWNLGRFLYVSATPTETLPWNSRCSRWQDYPVLIFYGAPVFCVLLPGWAANKVTIETAITITNHQSPFIVHHLDPTLLFIHPFTMSNHHQPLLTSINQWKAVLPMSNHQVTINESSIHHQSATS